MEVINENLSVEKLYMSDRNKFNKCYSKVDLSPIMPTFILWDDVELQKISTVFLAHITVNGKEFLSVYKKITMGKVFYKVYYLPSAEEDYTIEESLEALKILYDYIHFKNVVLSQELIDYLKLPENKYDELRSYVWCDPSTRFNVKAGLFRKRYDINKYKENLSYRKLEYKDYEQALELFSTWKTAKINATGKFSTPEFDKYLEEYLGIVNSSFIEPYGLFFDDKLIAFDLACYSPSGNTVYFIAGCNYTKNNSSLVYAENIGQMLFYYECEFFSRKGIKYLCGGTHAVSGSGVKHHKELMYKNVSPLYNLSLEEILDGRKNNISKIETE